MSSPIAMTAMMLQRSRFPALSKIEFSKNTPRLFHKRRRFMNGSLVYQYARIAQYIVVFISERKLIFVKEIDIIFIL